MFNQSQRRQKTGNIKKNKSNELKMIANMVDINATISRKTKKR